MIVDMFTRQFGRLSFIVSMPKTAKSKMKKQFFQPLSLLEIETDVRPKVQLQKLSDVRLSSPFTSIPFHPHKLSMALFMAEFLYYALRSEQRNELLYDYVESSILWLDGQDDRFANFHLVFLMRLSRFLGFYPNLEHYQSGDYFDLRESEFLPAPPVHRDFLYPEEADKVQLMMRMDYPTMHLFRMSHQERNRLLEVTLIYYRLHLPDFPEMKSIGVLQELYQ
jgi:DNA repair protein RecO (recombination protein O)